MSEALGIGARETIVIGVILSNGIQQVLAKTKPNKVGLVANRYIYTYLSNHTSRTYQ